MTKNLIFDLDDTLIKTTQHYINSEIYFVNLMAANGAPKDEAKELIKQIDLKLLSEYKYGYHWFQRGLIEGYKILSKKYNFKIENFENLIAEKIKAEFETERELWDNAEEILKYFYDLHYTMYIMTLGDYNIQMSKIKKTSIEQYFKKIFVVSKKDDDDYKNLIKETNINPNESWFIGNSIEHDITPALKFGFNCVLYNKHTTFYGMKLEIPKNVIVISDLLELKKIIK